MAGLNDVLNSARSALIAQQFALATTSNNVANASTPGYSRQRVDFQPAPSTPTNAGLLGTGVVASQIGRVRERFLDQQVWGSSDTSGKASTEQTILSQVEAAVNEPSDAGLSETLNGLFNALQGLSSQPEEQAARDNVVEQGQLVAQSFRNISANITQLRGDLVNDVQSKISNINELTGEISDLDVQIANASSQGMDPSSLEDRRDSKIDSLASLVKVNVVDNADGSSTVSIGGTIVASKTGAVTLTASATGGQIQVFADHSTQPTSVTSGELGADIECYNTTLPGYLTKLDATANALISRMNALHASGFGIDNPPTTGLAFFTGSSATDIAVNPVLVADSNKVAASADGSTGDNAVALQMANVQNEANMNGGTTTISQYYNTLVSSIGTAINAAQNTSTNQQLVLTQLQNQRTSVSGVSIDEEMTNLIQFQQAYDAASKVVSVVDQLFQSVIQMVQ